MVQVQNKGRGQERHLPIFSDIATADNSPSYIKCRIKYLDDNSQLEVMIKLSEEVEDNDEIFYYCSSMDEFMTLFCTNTATDFIVIDIVEFIGNKSKMVL